MKRYQILIPLSILVVLLVAACTGTAVIPQTGQTAPTQAASAVPQVTEVATQASGSATQSTGATPQATEMATQTNGSATQASGSATQTTGATPQATQAAGSTPQATPPATNATPPGYSPSAAGTATGNTAGVPVTGETNGNEAQSFVGELPNANPADVQSFIGAAQDLPDNLKSAVDAFLVNRLNADPDKVLIISAVKHDFNDACLGLAQQDETCAQAVTPGWLTIATLNGSFYVVHTSADGTNIRLETPVDNAGLTNFGRDFPIQGAGGE